MMLASIAIIIVSMNIMILCLLKSKKMIEKIMCLNCFTSYIVAMIAIISYIYDRNYIDLAIIYMLISFVLTGFLLDFLPNPTSAGNLSVDSVLESSCTLEYIPVLRSEPPSNSLAEAGYTKSLLKKEQ